MNYEDRLSIGEHFADANGIRINYYVSGEGPICLIPSPGWGVDVRYLRTLAPFEKYFTVVYYNTRLSGGSTGPDDPEKYTDQDMITDLDAIREYFMQSKVWLAGHAGSGHLVLNYALQYGEHVNGVIVIDPASGADDDLARQEFQNAVFKRKNEPFFEKGRAVLFREDKIERSLAEKVFLIMPFYFKDIRNMDLFPKVTSFNEKAFYYTRQSKLHTTNLLPQLNKIYVPVLVFAAADDFYYGPEAHAKRIHQHIPSAQLVVINDAGHFPWIEQPAEFFNAFTSWIKRQGL